MSYRWVIVREILHWQRWAGADQTRAKKTNRGHANHFCASQTNQIIMFFNSVATRDHCPFTLWMLISFDKVIQSNNIWVGLQLVILRLDFSHTDRLPAYRQTHSNVTGRQFLDYDRNVKASCTHAPWFCTFICKHLFNNTVYFLPWERHQFLLGISSQVIQKLLRHFTQNHKFELHGGPKRKKATTNAEIIQPVSAGRHYHPHSQT